MTETSFMKGFAYPRFILNQQAFVATNSNFKYISLLIDLLQEHPEMFKDTATTLLYILNLGMNYKPETLYSMFKTFIYTDFAKTDNLKLQKINTDTSFNNIIIADSIPILFTYYLSTNKVFKSFEPSMDMVYQELKLFLNSPDVYYSGKKYKINDLKPLFYNLAGFNFTEFLIYYAYYITYLIYGAPYQFYNEIGTASAAKGMLTDIDTYFESCLKLLTKETQIPILNFNATELYEKYKQEEQLLGLQGCLNKMLSFEEIIKLRNREMNKTTALLDENYQNQNSISQAFIKTHFVDVIDNVIEIGINENPFTKILNRIPNFTPLQLPFSVGNSRPINIDELMYITAYCSAGGNAQFMINSNLNYEYIDKNNSKIENESVGTTSARNENKIFTKQEFKTNINTFKRCMKAPFTDADIVLRMLIAYISRKFNMQQNDIFNTTDLGIDITEPIKIDHNIFTDKLFKTWYNNMLKGYYYSYPQIEKIISNLILTDGIFKEQLNDITSIWAIASDIYGQRPKAMVLCVYLMTWLKDAIDVYIQKEITKQNLLRFDFDRFNFMNYLTHFITMVYTDECERRIFKLYDSLIAYGFCMSDEYARFVNITQEDFEKHLMNSILQNVYISGNTDLCELYSIGGCTLYTKMIDINPFNRGYEFIKSMFGTFEELEYAKFMLMFFKDASLIKLIENTDSRETIKNVMIRYIKDYEMKFPYDIRNFVFDLNEGKLMFEPRNKKEWLDMKIKDGNVEINIYDYMLMYAFEQIKGNYHNDEFRAKELKVLENGIVNASEVETINKISYTELQSSVKHSLPVDILGIGEQFELPVLKYVGEWTTVNLKFIDPIGTKLITFNLKNNEGEYNNCIFMFSAAKLDTGFNAYV